LVLIPTHRTEFPGRATHLDGFGPESRVRKEYIDMSADAQSGVSHSGGTVGAVLVDRQPGQDVTLSFVPVPVPELLHGQVLIEPLFVGVCGSDLELLDGHMDQDYPVEYPLILGHEWSGTVAAVGRGVTGLEVGQLVIGHGSLGDNRWFGVTTNGAMAEQFVVPASLCFPVPQNISARQAAMVEPLACVLEGLHRAGGADASHTAMVFGCGTLGLAMIALLHTTGAVVVAVDPSASRRKLAEKFGADLALDAAEGDVLSSHIREHLGVSGADLVIEASGAPQAQSAALEVTAFRARVVYMGLTQGVATSAPLRLVQARLLSVMTSSGAPAEIWEPTLRLLARTGLDLTPAISDTFAFKDCRVALEAARSPETSGKVMLHP
jgi:threonine dehydrogenase-like Zn-dependent dehydrogenase